MAPQTFAVLIGIRSDKQCPSKWKLVSFNDRVRLLLPVVAGKLTFGYFGERPSGVVDRRGLADRFRRIPAVRLPLIDGRVRPEPAVP